jgi:hypothetical protein
VRTKHYTVHCPMRATSADRWGLELLTVEVVYPFGAPDSPVRLDVADYLLTYDASNCSAVHRWVNMTVAHGLTGQSNGTPDSPIIFSRAAL